LDLEKKAGLAKNDLAIQVGWQKRGLAKNITLKNSFFMIL